MTTIVMKMRMTAELNLVPSLLRAVEGLYMGFIGTLH